MSRFFDAKQSESETPVTPEEQARERAQQQVKLIRFEAEN